MDSSIKKLLLLAIILCLTPSLAIADPNVPVDATADITATVEGMIEWATNFDAIVLAAFTAQLDTPENSDSTILYTNQNVTLSSEQGTDAELNTGTANDDTLTTKYKIGTDGDASVSTGADSDAVTASNSDNWVEYDSFLDTGLVITHYDEDGAVVVTLEVEASFAAGNVANKGTYTCTQTITATWESNGVE